MLLRDKVVNRDALLKLRRWHRMLKSRDVAGVAKEFLSNKNFVAWLQLTKLLPEKIVTEAGAFRICELFGTWRLYRKDFAAWALLTWGEDMFSPEPMSVRLVWDALEKNRLVNVMGASSTGKTFTAIVYYLARYTLDPHWTRIDVIGPKKTQTKANSFAQFQNLFRASMFKIPGKSEAEYIGLDRKFGQGIFLTTLEGEGSDIRGIQLPVRPAHALPEIGTWGSHLVLCDEMQQIDKSIYEQIENLIGKSLTASDTWHRKVFASANPQFIDSPYGKICMPVGGWGMVTADADEWLGGNGMWWVVRLNATKTENYGIVDALRPKVETVADQIDSLGLPHPKIKDELKLFVKEHGQTAPFFLSTFGNQLPGNVKDTLHYIIDQRKGLCPGLQSWDSVQEKIQSCGGDTMAAHVFTFCYGMFPPSGSFGSVIKQEWMTRAAGEFIFSDVTENAAGFDLGYNHDLGIGAFARYGKAIGWRTYDGAEHYFGMMPATLSAPARPITYDVVQIDSLVTLQTKVDSVELGREIISQCESRGISPANVAVDATGVGEGTFSYLKHHWSPDVIGVDYRNRASEMKILEEDKEVPEQVYNMMVSELWYALAKWMQVEVVKLSRTIDQETISQLVGRMADSRKGGGRKISVETKELYKSRGNPSPDRADAVTLVLHAVRVRAGWVPSYVPKDALSKPEELPPPPEPDSDELPEFELEAPDLGEYREDGGYVSTGGDAENGFGLFP